MLDDEPEFGVFESSCQACEVFGPVDDLGLCAGCFAKLDRDMIRQRAWDYSATAFGVGPESREELRAATMAKHGDALEIIAPESGQQKPRGQRHRRRRQ
jgi:hypothetical protein